MPSLRASPEKPMSVLLTGASGFLGSVVLRQLAGETDVIALHRPGVSPEPLDGVRWVAQDLTAPLTQELPERIDAVIHLAQSRRYREFPDGALDMQEVNATATVRLLDYCCAAGGSSFTYASSGSVYAAGPKLLHEDDELRPDGFYDLSKLTGELAGEQFRSALKVHSLRFFFIYGPGQTARFIPGLLDRVRAGQDVTLAGPDGMRVNPVYVDDAAAAVVRSLELQDSHTLNVAGPDVVSVRDIAEIAGRLLGSAPSFSTGEPQADLVASIERQSAVIGAPRVGFEEGLRFTIEGR